MRLKWARQTLLTLVSAVLLCFGLGSAPLLAKALPDYKAEAGMMPIGSDAERPEAEIFHIAYALKEADPAAKANGWATGGLQRGNYERRIGFVTATVC